MNRRAFLETMCLGGLATFGRPRVTFAQAQQTGRLVFVLLRGGLDGLAAVAFRGDPAYRSLRGSLAFEDGDPWPLDGLLGLSPDLVPLREAWDRNELVARINGVMPPSVAPSSAGDHLRTSNVPASEPCMGAVWSSTTVVVMTEFGRTARPNGTRGTDRGTAGVGFLLGPKVAKSTVFSDWPGLATSALFEGRDLRPTLDTRAVLKAAIAGTFDLTAAQGVFPGSGAVRGAHQLMA